MSAPAIPAPTPREPLRVWLQVAFFVAVVKPFLVLFLGLRVRGREHLPPHDPFILIANHSSHLDAVSLLHLFPLGRLRRVRPVAAADYFERNRVISWLSRTFVHVLPIVRTGGSGADDPRQRMLDALRSGQTLILFPEGTRGSGRELGRFRYGVAWLAQELPGVPIVPAYLTNLGRALPKGQLVPLPVFAEVRLGPALWPRGDREAIRAALEDAVRALGGAARTGEAPQGGRRTANEERG